MKAKLSQLLSIYGWQLWIEVAILTTIGFIQVFSILNPSWFNNTEFEAAFRLIVLLVLGDILFRLAQINPQAQSAMQVYQRDEDAQKSIVELAKQYSARSAFIMSVGLGSRTDVIVSLAELGVNVTVFYQGIDGAIDTADANRSDGRIANIVERLDEINSSGKVNFLALRIPSTIRATILYDRKDKPIVAQVGWYTYITKDIGRIRVYGWENPSLVISRYTTEGQELLEFFHRIVLNYKDEANKTSRNAGNANR